MSAPLDATHDPARKSWVPSANADDTDFPIQNLPYGLFRRAGVEEPWRVGVAIGDRILDCKLALELCPWGGGIAPLLQPLAAGDLNTFMALGRPSQRVLREALSQALSEGSDQQPFLELCLLDQAQAQMALPCRIGDYTDFYTGIHHATAVGKLFRPDNPLLPNYKWVPIGYHGRTSTLIVSGQAFHRPLGQTKAPDEAEPVFGPCRRLDHELEVGVFVGRGNDIGQPIAIDDAEEHLFGIVLLNDWSARDIQAWEYQPLGPFLSKSFATTLSPWVVTMDALAPFRVPLRRPPDDPQPLAYLANEQQMQAGAVAITLEVALQTAAMRAQEMAPVVLTKSDYADAYWSAAQMLAHHASNGCKLQPGDLLGSGTQSGPSPGQGGSLLELTQGGKETIVLPGGEERRFLEDGDRILLRGHCERAGARRIGFGVCVGEVLPAPAWPPAATR
jgi:fumarylacetoacetase